MIIGVGTDLVEIARLQASLARHAERFLTRAFTERERHLGDERGRAAVVYYAGRWAAKEAVAKALGCGFGPECSWHEIEILNDPKGRPLVTLSGTAAATAAGLGVTQLHLSISHETTYAIAFAVAEG